MFMESHIIDLDECVINALNFLEKEKLPEIKVKKYREILVVGSQNAYVTGKVLFPDAIYANESNYLEKMKKLHRGDLCVLVSASGAKDAPAIARDARKKGMHVLLITNNSEAMAKESAHDVLVFDKIEEPYTYNVSTYLGMILSKTKEDPQAILRFLKGLKDEIPGNFADYDSFFFIIPEKFEVLRQMITTKFDELFGSKISARVFTFEQTKHAKTVVPNDKEMFISIGVTNNLFGKNRLNFDIPKNASYGFFMALTYYIIGHIQKQNPPYFRENIDRYAAETSRIFGQKIDSRFK
jgi:hypothetical protein